jgi:hypothetical protein
VIDEMGKPAGNASYIYVCDRGADNFEVFCHLTQADSDWVIRAKAKNRKLLTTDGESTTLGTMLGLLTGRGGCISASANGMYVRLSSRTIQCLSAWKG